MVKSMDEVIEFAESLSPQQREILIIRLTALDETDEAEQAEIEAEWDQEIERRVREVHDGTAIVVDRDEVLRRVRERLRK